MNIKAWIEATRLRTLPVSLAGVVTVLGYNLIYNNVKWVPLVICALFALLCQIASNYANEYFDFKAGRDRQGREGPRRGVTEGDITPSAMKRAVFVTLAVAACLGLSLIYWGGWWLIGAGAAIGLGVLAYSTGPYPLSTRGWGEVAVVVFFGLVPVNLTYYVETLEWSGVVLAGSLAIGLLGANVIIVNNYRDVDDDRAVNKLTLAVRLGRPFMRCLYVANAVVAMALVMPVWTGFSYGWYAVPVLTFAGEIAIAVTMGRREGRALTPLLGMTSVLMFLYAILFVVAASIMA
ncbi:MAG: 1,4-dihydroxy-2-naphthoate octaprenyltransferase [Muribaculaceae bacterium]|nr:1,4-dihydroxy-2-naphthoate octaprenyltransferase [Muribaculaceae bacterium]